MLATEPLLSLVIPTYNRAEFLGELLPNLAAEIAGVGHERVEIIIMDNCSTDHTAQVVERCRRLYPAGLSFEHHVQPVNVDMSKNIFTGFKLASGRFLWNICDDDLLEPGTLARVMANLLAHPKVNVFLLNRNIYDLTMSSLLCGNKLALDQPLELGAEEAICQFGGELVTVSCVILRKDRAGVGFQMPAYYDHGAEMLCLALESLADSNLFVMGDCFVRYREGNNASWNVIWPWIYIYGVPHVVASSTLGRRNPSLVCKFVAKRKNNLLYSCCYIATSKLGWIQRRLEPQKLKHYYREESHGVLLINFAFKSPKWLSRMTLYALASGQLIADEFKSRRTKNPLVMFQVAKIIRDKYFHLRQKEARSKAHTQARPMNWLDK